MRNVCRSGLKIGFFSLFYCLLPHAIAEKTTMPMYQISPVEDVFMRCTASEYKFQLPIPKRWKVNEAVLKFAYSNSAALLKRNSQLTISLNEKPLAQIKLDPLATEGYAEIKLPAWLLEPKYNTITVTAAQHYSTNCELPCVPELWTKLMMSEAILDIDYELLPVPESVSSVSNFLFDPKNPTLSEVNMVSHDLSDEQIKVGAIISSGIALRFDYRKTYFTASETLRANVDNVLYGTAEQLEPLLGKYAIDVTIDGPFIKLMHLPSINEEGDIEKDNTHALIIVSGKSVSDLTLAAETIDILSIPFPESSEMTIFEFNMPEISLYSGKQMLITDKRYPLNKLRFTTRTFRGLNAAPTNITFRVPSDFMIKPNQYVELSLDYAYGAALRNDSALNVILNGNHVGAIHLNNPDGELITGYKLTLPTHLFKGGENVVSFAAVLTPSITEHCSYIQSRNLFLTLFESSTLLFPTMPHRVELPKLDLLFVNGFPYTRWPDGHGTRMVLTEPSHQQVETAFNIVGMISQKNGYPLFSMEFSSQKDATYEGELIVIGKVDDIPKTYLKNSPLQLGDMHKVPYPVFESWDKKAALAFSRQKSGMSVDQGLLMQFQSPFKEGRTVTLFTAKTDNGVSRLGRAILENEVQSAALGDLVMVDYFFNELKAKRFGDGRDYKVTALAAGLSYKTGKGGEISKPDFYLSSYPLIYWLVAIGIFILLAIIAASLLKTHKQRRESGE